jgi:polyphenol oxidase
LHDSLRIVTRKRVTMADYIIPDWPAARQVRAMISTRVGGVSQGPYASLNLGTSVNDDVAAVAANRAILRQSLPREPLWLKQVHGTAVVDAATARPLTAADASFTRSPGIVCAVQVADCMPVLLCDRAGTVVAVAHAGWRGLCNGVLEHTLAAMRVEGQDIIAFLGPAIGAAEFEVGPEVRAAFIELDPAAAECFSPGKGDRWLADLYALGRQRLSALKVTRIYGGGYCTVRERERFFSYRRDGITGRMAALIWLTKKP